MEEVLKLAAAFLLGVFFWRWAGGFILRNILRNAGSTMREAVSALPQDSLLKVYKAASDEIDKRKRPEDSP